MGVGCASRMISDTQSPVPTGTVDLLMMISSWSITVAMDSAAWRTYWRSASPSTPEGVPTQIKTNSASLIASS